MDSPFLPDKLTTIDGYAFKNCTNLATISLPESLITIGDSTFYGCTKLETITIPKKVTSVGEYCFSRDTRLNKITFEGNAPAIGTGAFGQVVAKVYYLSESHTWTDEKRQNYGGTLEWIPYGILTLPS